MPQPSGKVNGNKKEAVVTPTRFAPRILPPVMPLILRVLSSTHGAYNIPELEDFESKAAHPARDPDRTVDK